MLNLIFRSIYIKVFIILFISVLAYQLFVPTDNFPINKNFQIQSGETEDVIVNRLTSDGFIRNSILSKLFSRYIFTESMQIGTFNFEKKSSLIEIISKLHQKPKTIKVTIPEGFTIAQVADRLVANLSKNNISNFDKEYFLENVKEGYIFPETYYFSVLADTRSVIKEMDQEYEKNINLLSKKPSKEEVIIASMLQREVKGEKDMGLVSGIVQNRLEVGMALQIDATVLYGQGAWKSRVLYKDLKSESDYNTYKNKGLPIGPISNPGKVALLAAMYPTKSKYFFYLTGRDGVTYFAQTGEGHVRNINLYLR
jgi:UPF0755 protein